MRPRIHCGTGLSAESSIELPPGAARHVQVLRMQPGDGITLFDGRGGEYAATIERMGRSDVTVRLGAHDAVEREAPRAVHLAVGMPANERMDWLVEKATELGAASIQPLVTAHGVLRLTGERATKKQAHWQAIAIAACEQCGRNRVPEVRPVLGLAAWLDASRTTSPLEGSRFVLSLSPTVRKDEVAGTPGSPEDVLVLSGPEGGLSPAEESDAVAHGFLPLTLGTRTLRAETAPLAALVRLAGE